MDNSFITGMEDLDGLTAIKRGFKYVDDHIYNVGNEYRRQLIKRVVRDEVTKMGRR